jgi:hypothetical protein
MSFVNRKVKKLIFVKKNWLNDPRIGCKYPYNLIDFFERDIDLKEELKEFERDEVVEV